MVFTLVFLLVVVLVYTFIIMYQYIYLQSVASETANRGAAYYVKQFDFYSQWPKDKNPYWRIIDTNSSGKISKLQDFTLEGLNSSIFPSVRTVKIENTNSFFSRQVKVSIQEEYSHPVGNLLKSFGLSPTIVLSAGTSSPLEDNAEFIRNLDMVMDIKNCLQNSDTKWIGSNAKVSDVIDKMVKKR